MKRSILLIVSVLAISGCAINQHVEKAEISENAEVCIIEDQAVRKGFLVEFEKVLQEKSIRYVVTDRAYANQNCEWSVTYTARWSWDLAMYMSYAEIKVFKNGILDGEAVYDSRRGGANMKKFIDSEPKIREMVEQLMQQDRRSQQAPVTPVTPVETEQEQSISTEPSEASYIDELIALAVLRDDGIITEEEFQKQKAAILARE